MTRKLSRRAFLAVLGAAAVSLACEPDWEFLRQKKRIGLALGGGGAKGLAHVLIFEALDELGIRPHRIAGTSIGAIMGALYASGLSGQDIRALIDGFVITDRDTWSNAFFNKNIFKWFEFLDPELGKGGLISGESFARFLQETIQATRFSQLEIPLQVVAADVWTGEEVVFSSGELLPAIQASIAIPGLFSPVTVRHRVLVDGGMVNPVPYDLLIPECDVTIAVDVSGTKSNDDDLTPSYFETIFNSFQIMQQAIVRQKLQRQKPDIYLKPHLVDVRVLEFYKAEEIYLQAAPIKRELIRRLEEFA